MEEEPELKMKSTQRREEIHSEHISKHLDPCVPEAITPGLFSIVNQ